MFCIISFIRGRGKLSEPRVVILGEASTDPEVSLNRWMMSGTALMCPDLQFLHLWVCCWEDLVERRGSAQGPTWSMPFINGDDLCARVRTHSVSDSPFKEKLGTRFHICVRFQIHKVTKAGMIGERTENSPCDGIWHCKGDSSPVKAVETTALWWKWLYEITWLSAKCPCLFRLGVIRTQRTV